MGLEIEDAVERMRANAGYITLFKEAFGTLPSADAMAAALAAYQRSLVSGNTRFDRYLFANDQNALSAEERRGLTIFSTKAGCLNCHDVFHPRFNPLGGGLALFTDFRFHNLGVGYKNGRMADFGRYWSTRLFDDWGAFRTPSLRNVALTAPYMHDGSLASLEEVVAFYDRGGNPNPNLSPSIRPLFLTEPEKQDLVAFLKTLTDPSLDGAVVNDISGPDELR